MSEESKNNSEKVYEYRGLNGMVYARPSSGGLISERTMKLSNPASLTYTMGSTVNFLVNCTEAVWGPGSYLKMKVNMTVPAGRRGFITGSIMNLFSQIRYSHRSGELLSQTLFSDVLANVNLKYRTSVSDYAKLYTLIGGNKFPGAGDFGPFVDEANSDGSAKDYYFAVPMSLFLPEFDNHNQYIPASLISGSRLEIVLNNDAATSGICSYVTDGAGNITPPGNLGLVTINSVEPIMILDSCRPFDELTKQLHEESADVEASGLQYTYSTHFGSQFTPGTSGAVNVDVLQSVSIAERAFIVFTVPDTVTTNNKYNFVSLAPTLGNNSGYAWQWRLGSQFKPLYSVSNDVESYMLTCQAFNSGFNQFSRDPAHTGVSIESFGSGHTVADGGGPLKQGTSCVYSCALEKSANGLSMTGDSSNNSRLLNFSVQGCTNLNLKATVFLSYVRCANLMIDSLSLIHI